MTIVVHIPGRSEWRPLLAHLSEATPARLLPVGEQSSVRLANREIMLIRGGVGKVRAAASTQYAILTWQPRLYILIGSAGAIAPDLHELDLLIARRAITYDLYDSLDADNTLIDDHRNVRAETAGFSRAEEARLPTLLRS